MKQTMHKSELSHKILRQEGIDKRAKQERERKAFREAQEKDGKYQEWLRGRDID